MSGVAPQLNSIQVKPKNVYRDREITNKIDRVIKVSDSKRWGIGVSVGHGFTKHGPSPCMGV